jgi:hypothetical protein
LLFPPKKSEYTNQAKNESANNKLINPQPKFKQPEFGVPFETLLFKPKILELMKLNLD